MCSSDLSDVADRLTQADEAFEQWTLTPGTAVEKGMVLVELE